jgi:putative endonuclease
MPNLFQHLLEKLKNLEVIFSMRKYYVYILTNYNHTVLYVGVTNNLSRRVSEHETKYYEKSFSAKYNTDKLVYYENFDNPSDAIAREKQLKNWHREWKVNLITAANPRWERLVVA